MTPIRFGAALVAAGIITLGGGALVGATEEWPHDTPSCSLLPTTVATDTVILRNANHAPRHLQLWEGAQLVFNEELAPGQSVRAARTGLVMWAGHQYHVADYEGVRWCQGEPEETTTSTTEPEETTTSTTEPEETTTSTTEPPASTTSTTEPEETTTSTTEPEPTTSTTEPAPTTSAPEPTTPTTGAQDVSVASNVVTAQSLVANGNVDPSGAPVDRLPHTGRDTGPIIALGTLLLGSGAALVAHARRVAAR